ncbi:MAG: prepilin-type N-terminal cleavage/methylation domain-containing protein [Clostridiales bacterium]|nr:prepilin-type N-terminal cleavage/methylation domain-containing protein [Clostridiales bacterium]
MRRNQKGFTLVELIIAVAILAVVTLAVCGFIIVGSRSYTSANTDIMLQQEAQLALNQISDVIIDTTDSINYGGRADSSSEMQMVLKDSEFSVEPTEKSLVVINRKDSNNDNPSYWFYWSQEDEIIYFNTSDDEVTDSSPEPGFEDANKAILAQHVKEFHVDISQFEENRVVMVSMTFANGSREYTTSNNITVRNRVLVNQVTVEPMKKATEFTITPIGDLVLEPGDHYTLTSAVEGTDEDTSVRWYLSAGAKNGTSVTEDGELTIGTTETRQSFKVCVTRAAYTDQASTKEVTVRIKRVNSVNLTSEESTAAPGETVTIEGSAAGYLLGSLCSSYSCAGDDLTQDWDLCDWTVVSGPATVTASDAGSVAIQVSASAREDDEIVVEAYSALSKNKNGGYGSKETPDTPPVKGTLTLTVSSPGDQPIQSGFKFGTDNDPGPLDYMRSNLKTDYSRYVYCVRVREMDSTTAEDDQVVLYYTTAANERFNPDLFGLDLNRSYYVFFQVLDPVSVETREKKANNEISGYYEDDAKDIVTEYLANLDSRGKYVGTKYEADDFYYGILSPPEITLAYNGVTYPNDDADYYEKYSFVTGGETVMGQPSLGDVLNVDSNVIMHNIRYTLYRGDGDDIEDWERICGFDGDDAVLSYDSDMTLPGGAITLYPDSSQFLKRDTSNTNLEEACGTYHIVPGYVYANDPTIRGGYEYLYKSDNINGDYDTHYYEQPDSTITIKIDMGLNLQLPSESGEERWTNFPLPTDSSFPFSLQSSDEQSVVYNFIQYTSGGVYTGYLSNIVVTCKYVAGVSGGADSYTITLSSRSVNGSKVTNHIYGTYSCAVGAEMWTRQHVESDETETALNITITKNGSTYAAYFPAPSDSAFPFSAGTSGEQTASYSLIAFNTSNSSDIQALNCTVTGTYTDEWSVRLTETEATSAHKTTTYCYGTYTCESGEWSLTGEGSTTVEAVWGARIYFTYNSDECMMEVPLPTDSDFPECTTADYTTSASVQYFLASDTYGENTWNYTWGAITFTYSYNSTTSTYTLTLKATGDSSKVYGTWTCAADGTSWTKSGS